MTPVKDPITSRSQISENTNPNLSTPKQKSKPQSSPSIKSAKSKKSAEKNSNPNLNPNSIVSPRNRNQERKFIVAKKKPKSADSSKAKVTCKCKDKIGGNPKKCPCIAYQNLRASQEEFFKSRGWADAKEGERAAEEDDSEGKENTPIGENVENGDGCEDKALEGNVSSPCLTNEFDEQHEVLGDMGSGTVKRKKDRLLEEARNSIPEPGSGRVMHLVQAFERLRMIPKSTDSKGEDGNEDNKKEMKWAALPLPGLHSPSPQETEESLSSFSPAELFFTSDNFGMDSKVSSSLDSCRGSLTSRSTSGSGRRSRRNSSDSCGAFGGRKWKKKQQVKVTRQQPFKLRTEQRGRSKEEEFLKKLQEMSLEEEKLRIPIAQGLPWTTDEPECLVKPPVKESTRPIDLKLHSDVRAVERAEFDHYVTEKLTLIEQYKLERERQQKLAEEEEIRRMRRELVPRAQPMPYFDRPFVPQRSSKNPTIPKEPKFNIPQHKKIKCMSWNDMEIYTHQH